jgi:hypothetical protein
MAELQGCYAEFSRLRKAIEEIDPADVPRTRDALRRIRDDLIGQDEPDEQDEEAERPAVVCLCGSMRFGAQIMAVAAEYTAAGEIVLAPFVTVQPGEQGTAAKAALDILHRHKIAMADRVIVVSDETGYYGTSTALEIEFAVAHDKPISYRRVATSKADSAEPGEATVERAARAWWDAEMSTRFRNPPDFDAPLCRVAREQYKIFARAALAAARQA